MFAFYVVSDPCLVTFLALPPSSLYVSFFIKVIIINIAACISRQTQRPTIPATSLFPT